VQEHTDLALQLDVAALIDRLVHLCGPTGWEPGRGHHNEIFDVFSGMVLAGLACSLNFTSSDDLVAFVTHHRNLFTWRAPPSTSR